MQIQFPEQHSSRRHRCRRHSAEVDGWLLLAGLSVREAASAKMHEHDVARFELRPIFIWANIYTNLGTTSAQTTLAALKLGRESKRESHKEQHLP